MELPNSGASTAGSIPEDPSRLSVVPRTGDGRDVDLAVQALKQDSVVLIPGLTADDADKMMLSIAEAVGLRSTLEVQAGFAGSLGHRSRIGQYYMSVNERGDYQFVTPHCEGSGFTNMQLASFYCYENSTDGGETILLNVDDSGDSWGLLRERVVRGRVGRSLTPGETAKARMMYRLNLPDDLLKHDDQVLRERDTAISGLKVIDALAVPKRAYSRILERELYVYWDTMGSIDADSAQEFAALLREVGLLKEPPGGLEVRQLDSAARNRVWSSGAKFDQLFRSRITYKLASGDFLVQNNLSWAHSVSNWTPGSGTRNVAASFA
jgi:hypothetical protein